MSGIYLLLNIHSKGLKNIIAAQKSPLGLFNSILANLHVKWIMINIDIPPTIENVIPKLFDKKKTVFAKNIKIGYPGKCGWRLIIL